MSELFSMQGRMYLATRDPVTFRPRNHFWVGNVPNASIELTTETSDKTESFSGQRLLYGQLQTAKNVNFTTTFDELFPQNLEIGLYGSTVEQAAAAVTDEAMPTGLVAGNVYQTVRKFIASVVITDSAGSPATLTLGTDYAIENAAAGIIRILNVASFTQPFLVDYQAGVASRIAMFTNVAAPERYVVFSGINTVNGIPTIIELYRVQISPTNELALINEDWGSLELNGAALFDEAQAVDAAFGGFGRITLNKDYTP